MTGTPEVIPWRSVESVPGLRPGEIHVWWQDLHHPDLEFESLFALLSAREQERVNRLKQLKHRKEYTLARAVARILLAGYLGLKPEDVRFTLGELGKPAVDNAHELGELCFNYTDAAGFAMYSFAWNCELGIDLESCTREVNHEGITRRMFTPGETEAIMGLPNDQQRRGFLACWTRKEGYGKALGVGIRYPFDQVELCADCASRYLAVNDHVDGGLWDLYQLYPNEEFIGALVHRSGPMQQSYYVLQCPNRF